MPVLRWGSQNSNGLSTPASAAAAAGHWRRAAWQVVFVQEHHLTLFTAVAVARQLRHSGWTAYFAFSPPGPSGRGRAGTAVLIRSDLLASGAIALVGGDAAVLRAADGRYIGMPVRWSGHDLHIASIYMPNGSTEQRQFIADVLPPLAASAGARGRLWGGDFNFVPAPHLDRLGHAAGAAHPDVGTQQRWQEALPGMLDVWRVRHPGRRAFTYVHSQAASRLDRFYISAFLLPWVAVCSVGRRTLSDHRPISLTLVGLQPSSTGRGLRRARLGFVSSPSLLQQMQAWLAQQLAAAPAGDHALLAWWPQFKRRLSTKCGELHRASRRMSQEAEGAGEQLAALHAQVDGGDEGVLPAVIAARQRFVEAAAASEAEAALRRRQRWLHRGERPCPALTRRLHARQQDRVVPALRGAAGQLLHSGSACAQRVADFWAGVSAQPAVDPAARQEVLQALATGRRLSAAQAQQLGATAVQPAEVLRALRSAPSGKSPGHDGLPVELYRKFKAVFAPFLARLFTAITTLGSLPARFHEGLITIIHKRGERSDPANYRPITLLCTDYRLFAKVLALRLNVCLGGIIDREQTAFVPGREIGENIMALQCLPYLLRRQRLGAVVVFCDFRKAYDTLDREFLFSAMHELGVGEGFLAMVRLLLHDTRARAMVNGHISTPAASVAGVRQGCPLAPLLYLFFAQALLRLLKARGIGVPVAGRHLTALQFADDAEVLLPSLDQVPSFLAAMHTFGDATGQRLNPDKTELLPIGDVPAGLPATAHGLRVVSTAHSLGVTFGATADPAAQWPVLLDGVRRCYTRLASLPRISVFGRGFASAAYGVSKVLYHAEFTGHPPVAVTQELERITAKVVERRLAPADTTRRFAGLAGWVLPGRPAEGGFGALSWAAHIGSRHAKWGLRLLLGSEDVPWVAVARELLRSCAGEVAAHPLGLLVWPAGELLPGMVAPLPPPLRRLHAALRSLPTAADVAEAPVPLGHWCWAAPLWGNPFFCTPVHQDGIDSAFFDFAAAGITSLGQLLHLQQAVSVAAGPAAYTLVWHTHLRRYAAFANRHHAVGRIDALLGTLPAAWVAAARVAATALAAGQLQLPRLHDALQIMLPRLGWQRPGRPLLLAGFTVRAGTDLLTAPVRQHRQERYLAPYAALALDAAEGPVDELLALLNRMWHTRWENERKEPFWRLVYDAFPTAARLHLEQPCLCGAAAPADRHHHFWACPVAQAVVAAVASAAGAQQQPPAQQPNQQQPAEQQPQQQPAQPPPLQQPAQPPLLQQPAPPPPQQQQRPPAQQHQVAAALPQQPAAQLTKASFWLARPPPAVYGGVWDVVCLAAVAAMGHGRRRMYAMSMGPPPPVPLHVSSARSAVARFWELLADFVALRCVPASWQARLPLAHPFIHFDAQAAAFRVHRPAP